MQRQFSISTPAEAIGTDAGGHADVVFTVANVASVPASGMAKLVPLGATRPEWLALAGSEERDFPAGAMHQFTVGVNVPAGVPAGRYPFRLDIINMRKAAEDHAESPVVTLDVPARTAAATKKAPSWIAVAALALLVVLGAGGYLLFRPVEPDPPPPTPVTTTTVTLPEITAATTTAPFVASRLVTVPNLIGVAVSKAEWELEAAGLKSTRKEVVDRAAQPGTVLRHTPKPSEQVDQGTNVELEVVIAPDLVTVPDVMGATWADAQQAIKSAGLVPVVERTEPRFPPWSPQTPARIKAQDPAGGMEVKRGSSVRLLVEGHD